jgi:hypothetical protein
MGVRIELGQEKYFISASHHFWHTYNKPPVIRKPACLSQCQFTNNESRVFEEKVIRFIICQRKRKIGRVNLSKLCSPTSERKCPFFKEEFRDLLQVRDKNAPPTMGASLGSPGALASHL